MTTATTIGVIPAGHYAFCDAMHLDGDDNDNQAIRLSTGADGGFTLLRVCDDDATDAVEIAHEGTDIAELALVPITGAHVQQAPVILTEDTPLISEELGFAFGPYRVPLTVDELSIGWCAGDGARLIADTQILVDPGFPKLTVRRVQAWIRTHPRPPGSVPLVAYPSYGGMSPKLVAKIHARIADSYTAAWEAMSA